jgi:membrane glycosyltransferase
VQLIPQAEATERQDFYDENGIGWVARPPHNPKPKAGERYFLRRGKFKKASNMNYALQLSIQVEEKLALIERHENWSQWHENQAYAQALKKVLIEREGEAWADGSVRVGDYILLIDSDTRVPQDCLLEAVSEMEQCPDVAILQYVSGVMNVTHTFFENGISFFTNMIYTMIKFAVANGDVAPFVGHNAVLRWKAIQGISYQCELDYSIKYWSENTVSEDFDMSLRLQCEGYTVRLGAYKDDGYKEGVSLTVYDELNRWEK